MLCVFSFIDDPVLLVRFMLRLDCMSSHINRTDFATKKVCSVLSMRI